MGNFTVSKYRLKVGPEVSTVAYFDNVKVGIRPPNPSVSNTLATSTTSIGNTKNGISTSISGEIYSQLVIDRETAMNTLCRHPKLRRSAARSTGRLLMTAGFKRP